MDKRLLTTSFLGSGFLIAYGILALSDKWIWAAVAAGIGSVFTLYFAYKVWRTVIRGRS